jgi:hypothetical protein
LKASDPHRAPLLEKGIITMPNDAEPECKKRIDKLANKALEDLKKVKDANPQLDLSLVEKSIGAIPLDNHHHL